MGFSLRIGSMLVTADTAAEAAELVRALGEVSEEPVKRPQGTGNIVETPAGWQIRLRTGSGKRIHRGGFKSLAEAETALTTLVDTGVAPALKRHRRAPPPPANDPIADDLGDEPAHAPIWPDWSWVAPMVGEGRLTGPASPPKPEAVPGERATSRWLTKKALAHQLPPGPRRKSEIHHRPTKTVVPEDRSQRIRASLPPRRGDQGKTDPNERTLPIAAARPARTRAPVPPPAPRAAAQLPPRCVRCIRVGHVEGDCPSAAPAPPGAPSLPTTWESRIGPEVDLTDLVDVPDAEPTVFPDLDLGTECHGCGQIGHQMDSSLCPLSTKGEHIEPAQKKRPATTEEWALWRAENPARKTLGSAFTETEREMRRQIAMVDPDQEPIDADRPRTRGECEGLPRPCPWISCRYHLAIDVSETGNLHRTFGLTDVSEMHETCALDIADRGGATLEEVGRTLNVTRERVRQLETLGLKNAARNAKRLRIAVEFAPDRQSNAPEDSL